MFLHQQVITLQILEFRRRMWTSNYCPMHTYKNIYATYIVYLKFEKKNAVTTLNVSN